MIELLATILIIGVIFFIGIVSFFNFQNNQREIFNKHQNKIFVEIAKTFFEETPSALPKKTLQSEYVTLKELRQNNYITDGFLDYDHKKFSDDSKVVVTRTGNGLYGYNGHLTTTNGSNYDTEKARINFKYTYTNIKDNMNNKISNKHYTNNTPIINITANSTNSIKIAAFMYTIYKNNVVFKQSEIYYMKYTNIYDDSIILDTSDYSDNSYKIKVTVFDESGYDISKQSEDIIIDTVKPKCSFSNMSSFEVLSGNNITMDLVCTDDFSLISNDTKNLSISDFSISTESGVLSKISKPKVIKNGYKYKLTITGKTYGKFKISLKSGRIKDNAMNSLGKVSSDNVTAYNKAAIGSCRTLSYNGMSQTLADGGTGIGFINNSGVNAGKYTVIMNTNTGYRYSDNTISKSLICEIAKVNSSTSCVPNLSYNGLSQAIATSSGCTLSNHIQTNAGSYNVSCIGDINHNNSSATCSISKKNPTLTLSKGSLEFLSCSSGTFTEKASVKGTFSNSSNATGKATVSPGSYSNISKNTAKTVTVSGVAKGSATVTVQFSPTDSTNYNSVSKTVSITVKKGQNSESSSCGDCITAASCVAAGCNKYSSWSKGTLVTYGPFAKLTSCNNYVYTKTYEKVDSCVISNSHDSGESSCNCKYHTRSCKSPKQSLSICGCKTYPTCCHS